MAGIPELSLINGAAKRQVENIEIKSSTIDPIRPLLMTSPLHSVPQESELPYHAAISVSFAILSNLGVNEPSHPWKFFSVRCMILDEGRYFDKPSLKILIICWGSRFTQQV